VGTFSCDKNIFQKFRQNAFQFLGSAVRGKIELFLGFFPKRHIRVQWYSRECSFNAHHLRIEKEGVMAYALTPKYRTTVINTKRKEHKKCQTTK
jgi:hypothetical protein